MKKSLPYHPTMWPDLFYCIKIMNDSSLAGLLHSHSAELFRITMQCMAFFWSKISQSLFIFQAFTDLRVKGEIWLWFLDVDSWREAGMPPWPTRSLMTAESDAGSPWLTRSLMTQGPPLHLKAWAMSNHNHNRTKNFRHVSFLKLW